jgi:TATA-box binding protein (TBP) (component of TFIID and TFIIIB)
MNNITFMDDQDNEEAIEYEKKIQIKRDEIYKQFKKKMNEMNDKNFVKREIELNKNSDLSKFIVIDKNDMINKIDNDKMQEFTNYIEDELIFKMMPEDIYISTMTVTCKIDNIKFNCENIARYVDLSYNDIVDIVCAYEDLRKNKTEKKIVYRSLPYIKNNKKGKKQNQKQKEVFYNQVSIHCKIKSKEDPVHIKLFKNGSIQITGCQTGNDIIEILTLIINKLKTEKYIIDTNTQKFIEKTFVSDKEYLDITCVSNLKVNMINTNFVMPFQINLEELYKRLLTKNTECRYDKLSHSCVNIKYNHPEKKVSIFVFEKGSIVITGAKNGEHIRMAYDYIYKILLANYRGIVKKTINIKYIESMQKQ